MGSYGGVAGPTASARHRPGARNPGWKSRWRPRAVAFHVQRACYAPADRGSARVRTQNCPGWPGTADRGTRRCSALVRRCVRRGRSVLRWPQTTDRPSTRPAPAITGHHGAGNRIDPRPPQRYRHYTGFGRHPPAFTALPLPQAEATAQCRRRRDGGPGHDSSGQVVPEAENGRAES